MPDGEIKKESNLLKVVTGGGNDEYWVLANWNDVPLEPSEIHGCVVRIHSGADSFEWNTHFEMDEWFFSLQRLSPTSYVIGTAAGYLVRVSGTTSELIQTNLDGGILDIWINSESNWWLAYGSGLAQYNGHTITPIWSGGRIHQIHGIGSEFAVAVGADGLILVFDGKSWREVDSPPTTRQLIGVFCVSKKQVFISGWNGALYEWDGKNAWKKIKFKGVSSPSEINAGSMTQYMNEIYVCANDAGLFKIAGKNAELVQEIYSSRVAVVNEKLIVTGENLFSEFDGENWFQAEIDLPD